ncbi:MAG: toll/interleukin-1 receptor domain-containing protein [Chloroflexota bacterium]
MTHDVFISYGREDSEMMQRVDQALSKAGLTTWTDHGIHPGSPSWKVDIETAIRNAGSIVVLFSPDSAESRWVRAELDYADAQHKPIYPLLVRGDATKSVPFGFNSYQWIDVRDSSQLNAGLERLIAVLKTGQGNLIETITPIPTAAPARSLTMLAIAVGLILAGLVLGIVLLSINAQTPVATPTESSNGDVAQALPTALPTMPPFTIPDGFKKVEGEKTIIAVPSNWSTKFDATLISESLMGIAGQNTNKSDLMKTIIAGTDILGVDLLHAYGTVITLENLGFPISYNLLKERQQELFQSYDPNGTYTNADLVEMPAGTMLYAKGDGSDHLTFIDDHILIRGPMLYHIMLSGRIVDRETLEQIGQQIATSFRVKE